MTNDLRIILLSQAWFMWIWAPVLKPENREELHQSLENNDWCWLVSLEAFLGSPALLFSYSLSLFLYYFFFLLSPSAHTSFHGLPRPWQKATAAKLAAWACLPASRAGIVFPEKWQMKNCLGYTNIHIYCVESLRFGAISFKELQKYFKYGWAFAPGLAGGKVCCSAQWWWSSYWNYSRYTLFELCEFELLMFVRVGFRNLRKFLNLQNK